jgi:hypothetical protein
MDLTQFATPTFVAIVVSALIGLVVKATRLQTNYESLAKDHSELKAKVDAHLMNTEIHFNLRISQEVDKRNEHRFETIEDQLKEINRKLDHIAGRE